MSLPILRNLAAVYWRRREVQHFEVGVVVRFHSLVDGDDSPLVGVRTLVNQAQI